MRAVPAGAAAVLFALALAPPPPGLRAQIPETGSIAGRVTLTTRVRGAPLPSNTYPSRSLGRHQPAGGSPELHNVVVFLRAPAFAGPLPAARRRIEQRHETFVPRVVAITRGSTVDFPNDDPFFHNVFSLSSAAEFDLGRYPQGSTRSRAFTRPGLVKVYCHIHSHMSASILVLDHPYFATPDADGRFTLEDVPAGRYTIVGWHERVGEREARIEVRSGEQARVELTLPVEEPR